MLALYTVISYKTTLRCNLSCFIGNKYKNLIVLYFRKTHIAQTFYLGGKFALVTAVLLTRLWHIEFTILFLGALRDVSINAASLRFRSQANMPIRKVRPKIEAGGQEHTNFIYWNRAVIRWLWRDFPYGENLTYLRVSCPCEIILIYQALGRSTRWYSTKYELFVNLLSCKKCALYFNFNFKYGTQFWI